jgi:hypothetical protein
MSCDEIDLILGNIRRSRSQSQSSRPPRPRDAIHQIVGRVLVAVVAICKAGWQRLFINLMNANLFYNYVLPTITVEQWQIIVQIMIPVNCI